MKPTTRTRSTVAGSILAFALIATACSSGGGTEAAAIATNDGALLFKPPDVLEGDPAPAPAAAAELPAPVDGLEATPVVNFAWFDGTAASTADFTGTPTVLNFWASNCAACIAEMPDFEAAHQALGDSVSFVGMNVADIREEAIKLAAVTGVSYPLADDTGSEVFRSFGAFVMPTTVLLNPQGQVAFVWSGALTGDELRILVDRHILPDSL